MNEDMQYANETPTCTHCSTAAPVREVRRAPTTWFGRAQTVQDRGTRRAHLRVAAVGGATVALAASVLLGTMTGATEKKPAHKVSPAMALARQEAIAPSSYPSGWKSAGSGSGDPYASFYNGASSSDVQLMSTCLGTSAAHVDPTPTEYAADSFFDPNSDMWASDSVEVFPNADAAQADVAAAGAAKIPTCLASLEGSDYTQDIELFNSKDATTTGTLNVTERSVPGLTTTSAEESMSLPVTSQGLTGPSYLDLVFVQAGRSESVFTIFNSGQSIPESVVTRLATAAANKMQAGAGGTSHAV
jgi:hypothetical protein